MDFVRFQNSKEVVDAMDGTKLFGYSAGEDEEGEGGATYDVQYFPLQSCINHS